MFSAQRIALLDRNKGELYYFSALTATRSVPLHRQVERLKILAFVLLSNPIRRSPSTSHSMSVDEEERDLDESGVEFDQVKVEESSENENERSRSRSRHGDDGDSDVDLESTFRPRFPRSRRRRQ